MHVPWNCEIVHDRLGPGRWNWGNQIMAWNLVAWCIADHCMKWAYSANVRIFWSRAAEGAVVLWTTCCMLQTEECKDHKNRCLGISLIKKIIFFWKYLHLWLYRFAMDQRCAYSMTQWSIVSVTVMLASHVNPLMCTLTWRSEMIITVTS